MCSDVEISKDDIIKLRDITGAGFVNCQKALLEACGDITKAINVLRINGIKLSQKREGNDIKNGSSFTCVNDSGDFGAIVCLRCETDFVAKTDIFQDFLKKTCAYCVKNKIVDKNDILINNNHIDDELALLVSRTGEKICFEYYFLAGEHMACYNHFNGRSSVLVSWNGENNDANIDICNDICLQICAMKPLYLSRDDLEGNVLEKEKELIRSEIKNMDNNNMLERIINGKLERFYKEKVLLDQEFVKDNHIIIKNIIKEHNIKINAFKHISIP